MNLLRRIYRSDEGIGVVTALMVAFVVFTLGGTWYAVSVHELDEVVFDRHRTQSVHSADAGVRDAMYQLANSGAVRDAAKGTGQYPNPMPATCGLTQISTDGDTVGEYWYRISDATPSDLADLRFLIESWGWSPTHLSRQAADKKVELEVTLIPQGGGFKYALFVGTQSLVGSQRKVLYGDVYSGDDAIIQQYTDINPNDGGFPGNGDLRVHDDLNISNNLDVAGTVTVNDYITQGSGTNATMGELIGVRNPASPPTDTVLRKLAVAGSMRFGVGRSYSTAAPNQISAGGGIIHNATGLVEVPFEPLPGFDWGEITDPPYSPVTDYSGASPWTDFKDWVDTNKTALSGAHYVHNSGQSTSWNLNGHTFADDFLLVVDGELTLQGSGSVAPGAEPVTLTVVGNEADSQITTGAPVVVTNENLRLVIYSKGTSVVGNPTTIYGAIYAEGGVSGTNLEVHFRPPTVEIGFEWDPSLATSYLPEPGTWREAPVDALPCALP